MHGYGGSSALFFEIFRPLSQHFHAIFLDIIGMGGSSRAPYNAETAEQGLDYFINFIENWRIQMNITDFYLVAHSFGGYLAGIYNTRFP